MPNFPIVDSHVHLWDPSHFRMAWLDGNERLGKPFKLKEYAEHTAGIEVEAMVYLEVDLATDYRLLEAKWVADQALEDDRLKGIVASAPIEYGKQVRAFLEALVAVSPRVKGVRRLTQGEADPEYCLQPRFLDGIRLLPEYGLSFDIGINFRQLGPSVEMVRRCPETQFILDHIAKPNIREQKMDPWKGQIEELAQLPNVVCKVSGVATETRGPDWKVEEVAPYIEHVLDTFGEDRVVYGGDWPVVLNGATYKRWYDTLDEITASRSEAFKRKLWNTNAKRFYRLGEGDAAD
jgi:L-fuconolactonase